MSWKKERESLLSQRLHSQPLTESPKPSETQKLDSALFFTEKETEAQKSLCSRQTLRRRPGAQIGKQEQGWEMRAEGCLRQSHSFC